MPRSAARGADLAGDQRARPRVEAGFDEPQRCGLPVLGPAARHRTLAASTSWPSRKIVAVTGTCSPTTAFAGGPEGVPGRTSIVIMRARLRVHAYRTRPRGRAASLPATGSPERDQSTTTERSTSPRSIWWNAVLDLVEADRLGHEPVEVEPALQVEVDEHREVAAAAGSRRTSSA